MFRTPPPQRILTGADVHVWRAKLDLPAARIGKLARTLSTDELERAARYRLEKRRRRFITARGVLRMLLGHYLALPAEQIVFHYHSNGKPMVANHIETKGIQFNLSHVDELTLYAFARERPVGIDIENLSRCIDFEPFARRFFSTREVEALLGVAKPLRKLAFLNCWTRKEAFVKATAEGLSRPLDQFEVSLVPGEPARLLHTASCQEEAHRWTMSVLDTGPDHAGALVVRGDGWTLHCWDWSG